MLMLLWLTLSGGANPAETHWIINSKKGDHFKGVPSTVSFDCEVSNLFVYGLVMTL